VIVDPDICEFFDLSEGKVPLAPAFFGRDSDGIYYQRYWTWYLYPPYVGSFVSYLNVTHNHILEKMERFKETPHLLEKYQWLKQEFENLVRVWKDLGFLPEQDA
jgi:hypothetical protein